MYYINTVKCGQVILSVGRCVWAHLTIGIQGEVTVEINILFAFGYLTVTYGVAALGQLGVRWSCFPFGKIGRPYSKYPWRLNLDTRSDFLL